ncbi:DUF5572 domain-containing protein [Aspergillus clavatus NRRL 1]|uniref:Uncharacterized protein n=1 Tax=Aspergillus clavatus (strain ATCC 1007 / CBS 513.65 / DSM 816 / NCTC 3887 / NRRL 1 / QM 1276 / 107) TaxID=344612 RepID=A1C4Q1_ASPCL|nr:uncharacterized protein ACLA_000800 [Aspergillus clavatus NRRL 1]EAW14669.1 conserved hypothetical protein [Aspergillus clavatus NRRL 1]
MASSTASQEDKKLNSRLLPDAVFEKFNSYSFISDREFAKGLAIILGHPDTPATRAEIDREDDLVLQAKCFYFSRKEKLPSPLDFKAYKAWRDSAASGDELLNRWESSKIVSRQASSTSPPTPLVQPDSVSANTSLPVQEPAYPSSFARIVELITTGQPIPGIQQIPDTVLTGHDTPSEKPRRRKPWEKENESSEILKQQR